MAAAGRGVVEVCEQRADTAHSCQRKSSCDGVIYCLKMADSSLKKIFVKQ